MTLPQRIALPLAILTAGCLEAQEPAVVDGLPQASAVADLTIAFTDAHLLSRPLGMVVDRRGHLRVVEAMESTVFVFDSAGRFLGRRGRGGRGPGEFESPGAIGTLDDSVWVSDSRLRRVSWFDLDGNHLHTRPWSSPARAPVFTPNEVRGVFVDGTAAAEAGVPGALLGSGSVTEVPLLRLDAEGTVLDTLHLLDVGSTTLMLEIRDLRSFTAQPFGARDLWAAFPDGSGVVVVERSAAGSDGTVPVEVTRLTPGGERVWSRVLESSARPVTSAEVDSAVAAIAERRRHLVSNRRTLERQVRRELHVPAYHPPVERVVAAADGRVLLRRRFPEPSGRYGWVVLESAGVPQAAVTVDTAVHVRWAGGRHLWGVRRDELGIPALVRLRRAEGPDGR
ncbi:MAG: 6-bladed beta-propeller [Gemmatimonadota bacterium]